MSNNKEQLESAAQRAVQRSGMKGLSFRTLAQEIGIKSSSVHYYFPEKSDLARTLIERYSIAFFEQLAVISQRRAGLRRKLSDFVAIFEEVATDRKLCLCGMMAAEIEQLDDGNRQLLAKFFTDIEQWLVDLLDAHQDEWHSTLAAEQLAHSIMAGLEGALLLDRVEQSSHRLHAMRTLMLSQLTE